MFAFFRSATGQDWIDQTAPPFAGRLIAVMVVISLANLALWCFGLRQAELLRAIEAGAAVVEENAKADMEEDQIRESIRLQRQSFKFWSTLAVIGDFVFAPLIPVLRTLAASVLFAAAAALFGRPTGYGVALAENATWQVFWAASAALQTLLKITVSPEAENSWILLLPAAEYPARLTLALTLLNPLVVCGWIAIGWSAWRRQQANVFLATIAIVLLASLETGILSTALLWLGALMRLTITFG